MSRSEKTTVTVQIHRDERGQDAILVSGDGDEESAVWLPRSQIEFENMGGGIIEVELPVWLAKEKGLI